MRGGRGVQQKTKTVIGFCGVKGPLMQAIPEVPRHAFVERVMTPIRLNDGDVTDDETDGQTATGRVNEKTTDDGNGTSLRGDVSNKMESYIFQQTCTNKHVFFENCQWATYVSVYTCLFIYTHMYIHSITVYCPILTFHILVYSICIYLENAYLIYIYIYI